MLRRKIIDGYHSKHGQNCRMCSSIIAKATKACIVGNGDDSTACCKITQTEMEDALEQSISEGCARDGITNLLEITLINLVREWAVQEDGRFARDSCG